MANARVTLPPRPSELLRAPPVVGEVLRSTGQALNDDTRVRMERRLGSDFSQVRVHTDARAAQSARAVDALAYTVGRDVVFGEGRYAPHSASGQRLLAHELAHVVQQRGAAPHPAADLRIGAAHDAHEAAADRSAQAALPGGAATSPMPATAGAVLQRQPLPGVADLPALSGGGSLLDKASPLLAAAAGSTTLEGFDTGQADVKPAHQKQLDATARNIQDLLRQYPLSTVSVIGHADTVDTEAKNLALGSARAAAVKRALIDRGVPEAIISVDSKGEGPRLAVKTRDETPNAANRRVEVNFHPRRSGLLPLGPQLRPPEMSRPPDKQPPIDITPKPIPDDGPRPPFRPRQPDYFKPIPPLRKGSGPKSVIDVIGEVLDPVIDAVAGGLSKNIRDKIKAGARSAVESGVAKGARTAAEAAGLKDPTGLDAIEKAAEAAIQEKGKSSP